jgi:hypothetical protein
MTSEEVRNRSRWWLLEGNCVPETAGPDEEEDDAEGSRGEAPEDDEAWSNEYICWRSFFELMPRAARISSSSTQSASRNGVACLSM